MHTTQLFTSQVALDPDALLSEKQASDFLGFTMRALQQWRQKGNGPKFVRISSRAIRYRKRDLVDWCEARLRTSTSDSGNIAGETQ